MPFEHYIYSGQRQLRCGYTTGTCAALAAAGAARLLLTGHRSGQLSLQTPKGWAVEVEPAELSMDSRGGALCGVIKDGGDDADVTQGLMVCAWVSTTDVPGISVDGGEGVGRVTKPGLDQPVGAAAINRVPRRMIQEQVSAVCRETGYQGGLSVIISIPGGEEAARRTFNPRLGVAGGLSILGTSGVVEPMSERAIVDTIALELRQAANEAGRLILTPGNYGTAYLTEQKLDAMGVPVVKCSNFIGDALDIAAGEKFRQVLVVGHIGKLVKLAGGVMNTHSRWADCRTELFCAHGAICGAGAQLCRSLMEAPSADACIALLDQEGLRRPVMDSLLSAIQCRLDHRAAAAFQVGAVLFSNEYGTLGRTSGAETLLKQWRTE